MKIFFVSFLISFFALLVVVPTSLAQENNKTVGESEITADVMEKGVKKSDYVLPYPGMLPDHPLYALKTLRDAILDKLIADPSRKTEFYILQADKHLNMSVFLIDKKNTTMAVETSNRAHGFLALAHGKLLELKNAQKAVPAQLLDRTEGSLQKHIEVLTELVEKTEGNEKDIFTKNLETTKTIWEEVVKLKT